MSQLRAPRRTPVWRVWGICVSFESFASHDWYVWLALHGSHDARRYEDFWKLSELGEKWNFQKQLLMFCSIIPSTLQDSSKLCEPWWALSFSPWNHWFGRWSCYSSTSMGASIWRKIPKNLWFWKMTDAFWVNKALRFGIVFTQAAAMYVAGSKESNLD